MKKEIKNDDQKEQETTSSIPKLKKKDTAEDTARRRDGLEGTKDAKSDDIGTDQRTDPITTKMQ